jgi:hypothetical protein
MRFELWKDGALILQLDDSKWVFSVIIEEGNK